MPCSEDRALLDYMYIPKPYTMESPNMEKATIFLSNRSQAVRLPKAIAFPPDVKRVEVLTVGRARILIPEGESWDSWFDSEGVSADFMKHREQPADQVRESL